MAGCLSGRCARRHRSLPIPLAGGPDGGGLQPLRGPRGLFLHGQGADLLADRKSTRLNSSHLVISYAVFCLKKKKKNKYTHTLSNSYSLRLVHTQLLPLAAPT